MIGIPLGPGFGAKRANCMNFGLLCKSTRGLVCLSAPDLSVLPPPHPFAVARETKHRKRTPRISLRCLLEPSELIWAACLLTSYHLQLPSADFVLGQYFVLSPKIIYILFISTAFSRNCQVV